MQKLNKVEQIQQINISEAKGLNAKQINGTYLLTKGKQNGLPVWENKGNFTSSRLRSSRQLLVQ